MSIRDKLLHEYREESFDPKTKAKQFEDGKSYFPCSEKIMFFNADYPEGNIVTEITMDNNVFATVKATVRCKDGVREASAKYYHSNENVFGVNYLASAQTIAISTALSNFGYKTKDEESGDPDGKMVIAPESSAPTEDFIPLSPPMDISGSGLTVEQAMSTAIFSPPFSGQTIKQILAMNNPKEIIDLKKILQIDVDIHTSRAAVAEVILPLLP